MAWRNGDNMVVELDDEISHVIGSSADKRNWKKYWMDHTDRNFPRKCQIYGCGNPAQVGAHVYIKYLRQNFILPTCQACNKDPEQQYGRGTVSAKAKAVVVRAPSHENTFT